MAATNAASLEALRKLSATDPPLWLTPNTSLSETARTASQQIFASLRPFAPKSPFDNLLVEGFDAEQIWQQIDLQSQPLIKGIRREIRRIEESGEELFGGSAGDVGEGVDAEAEDAEEEDEDFEDEKEDGDEEDEAEGESDEEEGEEREGGGGGGGVEGGIEDGFLKMDELEEFMEEDEAREYGLEKGSKKKGKKKEEKVDEDADEEDDEDEDDDDEELGVFGEDGEEMDDIDDARYEDFFVSKKNDKKRSKTLAEASDDDLDMEDDQDEDQNEDNISTQQKEINDLRSKVNQMEKADVSKDSLSTHEKELQKLRVKMEQMEKEMLEPKPWIMQGEVTAAQRPKNSALEVDLDFEHNVRPAPVITEEVKASIEELIKRRISEGQFDDVQKPPTLPTKAPREYKEMDENKSKKGLAELYEEEYVQKTNPAFTPISFSDELKNEASMLFKKLCLKLDALSHFHFTPKPVIEDMSIQTNVPALAMEEIAPLAVSDATMLAPEEVFSGKGDVKEEAELTQEERKRRRAKKKRKFKAESAKRATKKSRDTAVANHDDGKD